MTGSKPSLQRLQNFVNKRHFLRGTQDVLAAFKEKVLFKLKFRHALLRELREERANIDATLSQ